MVVLSRVSLVMAVLLCGLPFFGSAAHAQTATPLSDVGATGGASNDAVASDTEVTAAPAAASLLPQDTVLFVEISSVEELRERFRETTFARMLQDEELAPLLGDVYNAVDEQYEENVREKTGVALADLRQVFQGEITFAMAAPRNEDLAMVLMIDIGQDNEVAQSLIDNGRRIAIENERTESTEDIGETTVQILDGNSPVMYFVRDGKLCASNSLEMIRSILNRWDGNVDKRDRSLAENRKFMNVMSRCNGPKDEPPQIRFFIDPIELYRDATRGNVGATVALGIMRQLGVDGFSAIGASMIFAPEDFDAVFHVDVLLTSPRAGVIEAISIHAGDLTPEPWVPYSVSNYFSGNWDFEKTWFEAGKLVDTFQGEGKFDEFVQNRLNEKTGLDFNVDVIPALDGRLTFATWLEDAESVNGNANVLSIGLKDPETFSGTLLQILDAIDGELDGEHPLNEREHLGVTYYSPEFSDLDERFEERHQRRVKRAEKKGEEPPRKRARMAMRSPTPSFGIVGDYMLLTDSEAMLKLAIETLDDPDNSLAFDAGYDEIMQQVRKHLGKEPAMIQFSRPEEGFRLLYEMAQGEKTNEFLQDRGDDSSFAKSLGAAIESNQLPEFEHFLKYMSPSGGALFNDESGFHYMSFQLRPEE